MFQRNALKFAYILEYENACASFFFTSYKYVIYFPLVNTHRRQTSGCRCTRCFFSLVVLNKSQILINMSRILILHPLFSGPFGANVNTLVYVNIDHTDQGN